MRTARSRQFTLSGRTFLLLAVIIFGAANAVTRKLTDIGAQHPVQGRNPISFCNALFVGNLVALITLLVVYWRDLRPGIWRDLSGRSWVTLVVIAVLSGAMAPALIFSALEQTTVNNVVLISRIEPPLTLALSVLLLRERVNRWVVAGAVVAFVGVGLTILLQPPAEPMMQMAGLMVGEGEALAVGGAIVGTIATVISKTSLEQVPLGLFNIVRTALGTVVFFVAATVLYGPDHFQDVFQPLVWQWMVLYGVVIVVGGQLAWFRGLRDSTAAEVSLANSFSPIAGILAAFLILGDVPTLAQYIGGMVILAGIALNQWGVSRGAIPTLPHTPKELESGLGFRGI